MASARGLFGRITTLRLPFSAYTSPATRVVGCTNIRTFSTPKNDPYASVLQDLNDVLGDHSSNEQSEEHQQAGSPNRRGKREQIKAEFLPNIRRYIDEHDSPNVRWQKHHKLASFSPRDASDEQFYISSTPPTWNIDQPFYREKHRTLLDPPPSFYSRLKSPKMRSFVQILTTPTADTPGTTLLLHFDNKRYLIGSIAEGTQRASVQMGARLLKVSECFMTGRTEWKNTGGLIGMILTLADATSASAANNMEEVRKKARTQAKEMGVEEDEQKVREIEEDIRKTSYTSTLTLFAPPNMNHTLATARRFVFRKGMPVNVHEIQSNRSRKEGEDEWAPYCHDSNVKVWAMSILPSGATPSSKVSARPSMSPRKRSIEELYADEQSGTSGAVAGDDLMPAERSQLTTKAIVGEMFNSSWRLDTLYPTRLADVKMPASIFVRNSQTNKIERYSGPSPGGKAPLSNPDLEVLVRKPWPGALVESLPPTEPAKEAVSYIFRNHTQRGKFNPQQAKELKVPKGPAYSKLAAGESVPNEDGVMIHPEQVLAPSKDGGGVAVVDIPDPSYIENLLARPEWREQKVMVGVGAMVWICGPGVALDDRVRAFMQEFKHLEHVVSSPDYCSNNIALDSAAAATVRLREIDGKRYRIPDHGNREATKNTMERPLPKNAQNAVRGQIIQLEPSIDVNRKQAIQALDIEAVKTEISKEVLDEAAKVHETVAGDETALASWASTLPDPNVEITTLGTGSALPSKYRNVSATLMRVPGWGNMLFDCGENTLGQLKRVFPPAELDEILRNLRLIFISHMHADHHLGTVSVIKAWYELVHNGQPAPQVPADTEPSKLFEGPDRITIIAEPAMTLWLSEYAAVEDYGFSRLAPLNCSPAFPYRNQRSRLNWFVPPAELAAMQYEDRKAKFADSEIPPELIGLKDVQAVLVTHCHGARAVSITWPSGFKASYSGDCRPSTNFAEIGKGSTVCIHEATFDDELQGDAEAKNHSTTSEALSVAQGMGAKACVLTHFSQRYQKLPVMEHGDESNGTTQDVPMLNATSAETASEEVSANPEDAMEAPIEDVADTVTYAQQPAEGKGQQHELPSDHRKSSSAPEAVKFKLRSDMKVCVAFDYMRVKVGEIAEMQHYTPALLKLFAEEDKEGEVADGDQAGANGKKQKQKQKGGVAGQRGNVGAKKEKGSGKRKSIEVARS